MFIKKFGITLICAATFGFMACSDDSSSSPEKNTDPSPTDPVKCEFKEADGGLSFTKILTITNENSGEIEKYETKGSCVKDSCSVIKTTQYKGHFDNESNATYSDAEDGKIDEYYQNAFKDQMMRYEEDCNQMNGKTRQEYDNYTALMESISCSVDDSTATHYKQTFTKDGKDASTEYTLDGTTITIQMAEPIINKDDSRCPEKGEIQNDEKQITCDDNFMTTSSKVEAKDEEDAQKKFAQLIKGSNGVCRYYKGDIKG